MISSLWALVILSVTNGITVLTSYISNNTFPQPLTEHEEAEYISRLNRGDLKARHILAEHNLRLVAHIVKTLGTPTDVPAAGDTAPGHSPAVLFSPSPKPLDPFSCICTNSSARTGSNCRPDPLFIFSRASTTDIARR